VCIPKLNKIFIHLFLSEEKVVTSESSNIDCRDSINVRSKAIFFTNPISFSRTQTKGYISKLQIKVLEIK